MRKTMLILLSAVIFLLFVGFNMVFLFFKEKFPGILNNFVLIVGYILFLLLAIIISFGFSSKSKKRH